MTAAIQQFALASDSLGQGTVLGYSYGQNGVNGSWFDQLAESIAAVPGIGPLVSSGFRGVWHTSGSPFFGSGEWSRTGVWSDVTSAKAFDKCLSGVNDTAAVAKFASGTGKSQLWTKPLWWRPIVGFTIYYIDFDDSAGSGAVAGNWSYSVDGAPRVAMGETIQNNNALKKFYVAGTVRSSVEIFATQTDGSTAAGCLPIGIEVFYLDPLSSSTTGVIFHNVSVSGSKFHDWCASTSGNRLAWFNAFTLGTNAITHAPNAGTLVFGINDVLLANKTNYATDLTTLHTAASAHGPVGFIKCYEAYTGTYPQAGGNGQTDYRAQMATTGASLGAQAFDLYAKWLASGITGWSDAYYAGYLYPDGIHQIGGGHNAMFDALVGWVRANFFNTEPNFAPALPVAAKPSTDIPYSAKAGAVPYSAGRSPRSAV